MQNNQIIQHFNDKSAHYHHGGKIRYNQSFKSNMNSAFQSYARTLLSRSTDLSAKVSGPKQKL